MSELSIFINPLRTGDGLVSASAIGAGNSSVTVADTGVGAVNVVCDGTQTMHCTSTGVDVTGALTVYSPDLSKNLGVSVSNTGVVTQSINAFTSLVMDRNTLTYSNTSTASDPTYMQITCDGGQDRAFRIANAPGTTTQFEMRASSANTNMLRSAFGQLLLLAEAGNQVNVNGFTGFRQ